MPAPKFGPTSISADVLRFLIERGADSPILRARLDFTDAETFRKMLAKVADSDRVHPSMLPTQASGRWSTLDPPVVNFPTDERAKKKGLPPLRSVFVPDVDRYWLGFDWDAIEGRHLAVYSGDAVDIEAFNRGWDVHTLTGADVFKYPKPPDPTNAVHTCECADCTAWRKRVKWGGKDDLRRKLAKNSRYALGYGGDPNDPYNLRRAAKAILAQPGIRELGLHDHQLIDVGVKYLQARPGLVEWKARTWAECIRTRVSRTALGRRRMLFGAAEYVAREGLNHKIQGLVADMMNWVLRQLVGLEDGIWRDIGWLAFQSHDGARISLPLSFPPREALEQAKPIVERVWEIEGRQMLYTASWEVTYPDGRKEKL